MARHAEVVSGDGGPLLRIGEADYRAVVVPPLLTVRKTTLDLLRGFKDAGGTVVFAGEVPEHVDAVPSEEAADLADSCARAPAEGKELARAVEAAARRISILDPDGDEIEPALYCLREDRDDFYLFVCNLGHNFTEREGDDPIAACRPDRQSPRG